MPNKHYTFNKIIIVVVNTLVALLIAYIVWPIYRELFPLFSLTIIPLMLLNIYSLTSSWHRYWTKKTIALLTSALLTLIYVAFAFVFILLFSGLIGFSRNSSEWALTMSVLVALPTAVLSYAYSAHRLYSKYSGEHKSTTGGAKDLRTPEQNLTRKTSAYRKIIVGLDALFIMLLISPWLMDFFYDWIEATPVFIMVAVVLINMCCHASYMKPGRLKRIITTVSSVLIMLVVIAISTFLLMWAYTYQARGLMTDLGSVYLAGMLPLCALIYVYATLKLYIRKSV